MRGVTRGLPNVAHIREFLLTRLMRGVTIVNNYFITNEIFLLTRLMRGVTPYRFGIIRP